MPELLAGLALLALGGLLSLPAGRRAGLLGGLAGLILVLGGAAQTLLTGQSQSLSLPWTVPLNLGLDDLSAFFLIPTALLGGLATVYAMTYFRQGAPWLFLNLMLASLGFVLICRTPLAFLMAWEVMALSSFFLVTLHNESREVRRAGWIYLAATHLGSFFLMGSFLATEPSVIFGLALIGFGSKAGLVPLHIWLPEAHPVAPSPVSALMSGVLLNAGLYGILRTLEQVGPGPAWWGWTLLLVGAVTALGGVLFALAQRNLKRLLAYSSVENMGLIAMGLGLGLLGQPLGYAAALLHVLTHSLLKGLCFLSAGSVLHQAHTADIERLGGLMRRMPVTAVTFLVGAAGLAGLPPLGGFVTEFLLLFAGLAGVRGGAVLPGLVTLMTVALVAGLSLATFSKAFGIVFLGEPRSPEAERARDPGPSMLGPMLILAGLAPLLTALSPVLLDLLGARLGADFESARAGLTGCLLGFGLLAPLVLVLVGLRSWLLQGRPVALAPTWDCGYHAATPRMEYTGLSFSQPLTDLFASLLHHRTRQGAIQGVFPAETSFSDTTPDRVQNELFRPLLEGLQRASLGLRRLQHGRVQIYVLYILVTLVGLLTWGLW